MKAARHRDIIKRLQRILDAKNDCDNDSDTGSCGKLEGGQDANPGMSLTEKMQLMWDNESNDMERDDIDHIQAIPDALDDPDDDDLLVEIRVLSEHRKSLLETSAYRWLQSAVQLRSTLRIPENEDTAVAYHNIGDQIIKANNAASGSVRFSQKRTQQLSMNFTIDWDPFAFSREQEYDATISHVLAHAITLTGINNSLLAATCKDYLMQTWPETGLALLSLLQQALDDGGSNITTALGDATRLTANFENSKLTLTAVGNVFSVAEVAEQISWIGAALRSSPSDEDAAYCTPHITALRIDKAISAGQAAATSGNCRIGFKLEIVHDNELAKAGKCWRGMFGNPVIVRGYPIPCRPEADTGLEISLDLVSGLTNCQRIVNFAGMTFIKGFAAMLAAVRTIGDVVFWHLCYNPGGEYISYEDVRMQRNLSQTQHLSIDVLQRSRHIVGWSDSVKNYAGREISFFYLSNPAFVNAPAVTDILSRCPRRRIRH